MKKKFGIIGNPIKHSLSPTLHNYWFRKYGIDADYSIIDVEENGLPGVIDMVRNKDLFGINITLPFKQKIVPLLDILVNDAQITSSVNTVYLNDKDLLVGENSDVFGLQAAYLKEVDNITAVSGDGVHGLLFPDSTTDQITIGKTLWLDFLIILK